MKKKLTPRTARAMSAADQENARARDERERSPDGMTAAERAMSGSRRGGKKRPAAEPAKLHRGPTKLGKAGVTIQLTPDERVALQTIADVELRSAASQARWIVVQAIEAARKEGRIR